MKHITIFIFVWVSIQFCTIVLGQESMNVNIESIHNTFLKDVSAHLLYPGEDNTKPILSTFGEKTYDSGYATPVLGYNDFEVDVMITSDRQDHSYAVEDEGWEPDAIGIGKTLGNFMIVYIIGRDGESAVGWLYTISYDGVVIDGLEFHRWLHAEKTTQTLGADNTICSNSKTIYVSDLNSRLNSDLTISQTFIDWGTEQHNFYPFSIREGTRFDLKYEISSTGYFKCISMKKFKSKSYSPEDLEISKKPNNEGRFGLERGNEDIDSKGLFYSTKELWENDIKKNRFPIYEHKFKEIPQGVKIW